MVHRFIRMVRYLALRRSSFVPRRNMSINNNLIPGFNDERDESLKISLEKVDSVDNCIILYLNGYIDTYNSAIFQKRVAKVVEAGFINLIFNCTSLNYVSSTGIGALTSFQKMVKPKGGDIVLFEIQSKVYEVFQLLGFSQFFNIRETQEEAITFFSEEPVIQESIFPKIFACPVCSKKLKATKAGRFRCSECKSILAIDNQGQVLLG